MHNKLEKNETNQETTSRSSRRMFLLSRPALTTNYEN